MREDHDLSLWKRAVAVGAVLLLVVAVTVGPAGGRQSGTGGTQGGGGRADNVVYLQGDGMGAAQRELIRLATVGQRDDLVMNELPVTGSVHTSSADTMMAVTDSAAAATALATGHKTYNGGIGVDAKGRTVPTILERARKAGKATGLVTTSQVTDASPAAFAAHVPDRADQSEIARQYVEETRPDVLLGGGEDWWYPKGEPGAWPDNPETDPEEDSRGTRGNLVERAERAGYQYVTNADELAAADGDKLLGLFANEEMFEYRPEGEGDLYAPSVPLPTMAAKALETLAKRPGGFFLMIEEEGIDAMGHVNNAQRMIEAGEALDRTVAVVLAFAKKNPRTLVIVGGDHETGGLAIENVNPRDETGNTDSGEDGPFRVADSHLMFTVDWTTREHTAVDTPVTAQGPGSARLEGTIDNTDVYRAMAAALGLG